MRSERLISQEANITTQDVSVVSVLLKDNLQLTMNFLNHPAKLLVQLVIIFLPIRGVSFLWKEEEEEVTENCLTIDGCKAIICAAEKKCDTRILGLGEDLIAKEAKYHNTCRRNYVRQDEDEEEQTSNRKKHSEAFQTLLNFLDSELIKKKKPMLATSIFSLYKEEFLALGGTHDDISKYSVQSLMTKVKDHFEDIVMDKQANKSGNVVFPSIMTSAEAFALLNEPSDTAEKIRHVAMALRTEIFAMPSSKIPLTSPL